MKHTEEAPAWASQRARKERQRRQAHEDVAAGGMVLTHGENATPADPRGVSLGAEDGQTRAATECAPAQSHASERAVVSCCEGWVIMVSRCSERRTEHYGGDVMRLRGYRSTKETRSAWAGAPIVLVLATIIVARLIAQQPAVPIHSRRESIHTSKSSAWW